MRLHYWIKCIRETLTKHLNHQIYPGWGFGNLNTDRPIWQVRYIKLHVIVMKFVFKSKHLYMLILRTNTQCYMQMLQVLRTSVKCLFFAGVTGYWLFAGITGYWQVSSIIV